jgi:hypothetical protein
LGRLLIVISVVLNLLPTLVNPQMPEMMASPLFSYYLAHVWSGEFLVNLGTGFGLQDGWTVVPLLLVDAAAVAWLLVGLREDAPKKQRTPRKTTRRRSAA